MKDPNLNKPIWFPLHISLNAEWMEQPCRKAEGWMFKRWDVHRWEADLTRAQVCRAGRCIGCDRYVEAGYPGDLYQSQAPNEFFQRAGMLPCFGSFGPDIALLFLLLQ